MSDKGQPKTDETREGAGADITDNRNGDMAPKESDTLPSRAQGGSDAEQEIAAPEHAQGGAGVGGVPGGKAGQGMGTEGAGGGDARNPDGSARNTGPGTTHTVGRDTGQS